MPDPPKGTLQGRHSQSTSLPSRHTSHPNKETKHFHSHSHSQPIRTSHFYHQLYIHVSLGIYIYIYFTLKKKTNYSGATKYGYQRNPCNASMTLLFEVLTENDSFRSCIQHIRLPPSCTYPQYIYIFKYVYIRTQLVLMCVRADAYNLILIFASYYYTPWPWSCIIILRMIRERHVKLLYCLYSIIIVIYNFEMLVWGTYNYSSDIPL